MDLFVIEGAGKIKKITSYLKEMNINAKVIATCGHIERLKDSEYDATGIDKELNFHFEWIEGKSKIIKEINELGNHCNNIFIASDPDREGEGIAWHIYNKLSSTNKNKYKRITFNEISKKAILEAINNPRKIDKNYVDAYLARIALDKKIGYGLSKFLQQNVKLPSAGRVQSVVLKLIKEREDKINQFVPKTIYFFEPIINGIKLKHVNSYNSMSLFTNHLEKPFTFLALGEAMHYQTLYLNNNQFKLIHIDEPEIKTTYPSKPFKTSTAQTELIKELKINSKEAEKLLQELYQMGMITYPRTDATRMSVDFCHEAYAFVKNQYPDLANNEFRFNKSGSGAQDAHEAIRVVHLEDCGNQLSGNLKLAYDLIYQQTIIQFMNPMTSQITKYTFINNQDEFMAEAKEIVDSGYNAYLKKELEDKILNFNLDEIYQASNFTELIKDSTTTPPSPFNQASLTKELEKLKIGRPSTYASSVEINQQRNYAAIDNKGIIHTTNQGVNAHRCLQETWNELINYSFTAQMEESLDDIANGKLDYQQYLKEFLNIFENKLYQKVSLQNPTKLKEVVGTCPFCNSDVVLKIASTGKKWKECVKRKYNPQIKKVKGCKYYEWINE